MKLSAVALCASIALAPHLAGAANLQITGWWLGGTSANVSVYNGSFVTGTYAIGSFNAKLDGTPIGSPIYCLDLFHSFSFGSNWQVNPIIIPPDPPNPPPFNTGEAAYVFNHYGLSASNAIEAAGVQLALWEVSHQQDWRSAYTSTTWWSQGHFKYNQLTANPLRNHATAILDNVYANYTPELAGRAVYYQPDPQTPSSYHGQGQIGQVPEPGTALLLGLGLLAGKVARRRRR